ncbi:hypothetical protein DPMN_045918 [Dreissena polymorpha]|uniref:Uncharacterized protein n=1 Tax=Dreissena polymorpha TaxID=45954 RepID=A0A9D4I046_DREPO|nr:hypothetical protein DPMN_045918 [Dreissena polymorpha]
MRTTPALDTSQLLWTGYTTLLPKSALGADRAITFTWKRAVKTCLLLICLCILLCEADKE